MTINDNNALDDNNATDPQRQEINRLMQSALAVGRPDAYSGKRDQTRYVMGMPLQLSIDPNDPSVTWNGIMHNVSGGGFGVWSRRKVDTKSLLYVRDNSGSAYTPWLKAEVRHISAGLRGYLVGAAFIPPLPEEKKDQVLETTTVEEAVDKAVSATATAISASPVHTLQRKIALASAATSSMVLGVALMMKDYVAAYGWSIWLIAMCFALVYGLGCLVAWGILRSDLRYLKKFSEGIRSMVANEPHSLMTSRAPSLELEQLRSSFVDLASVLRKREDHQRPFRQKLEELTTVKTNILSVVSHDLRTPLTSILLYTKMLQDELDTLGKDDQRHFLGIISDECKRLSRLVDDLLEVRGLEAGQTQWHMESQDLTETLCSCARVFEAMAKSKSIHFIVDCPESLPPVEADADKISQVIHHLITNALKYTPNGGQVRLSACDDGQKVLFCVDDNGPGIPRDQWDHIFGRFTQLSGPDTREMSGAGLGLYIVRKIVEKHGGIAWVDSEVGQGSQFFVSLPIKTEEVRPVRDETVPSAGRVLVCDADPELTATMASILQEQGFDVCAVHSACRLLGQLAQGDIDVVVTDVLLPDMSAAELLNSLDVMEPRSFRLVLHSYAGEATELRRRGVDVLLQRPASRDELVQAVHVAMKRQSASGMTVLLAAGGHGQIEKLQRSFADSGHFPIVAENGGEAYRLLRHYPVDLAVLTDEILGKDWAELKTMGIEPDQGLPVFVLCGRLRKKERYLAETHGVTPLAYRPGDEQAIVEAVMSAQQSPSPILSTH